MAGSVWSPVNWVSICSGNGNYLTQCCWTLRNKYNLSLNRKTQFFIHENLFENVVCEMIDNLSRKRWVKQFLLLMVWLHYFLSDWLLSQIPMVDQLLCLSMIPLYKPKLIWSIIGTVAGFTMNINYTGYCQATFMLSLSARRRILFSVIY